MKIIFYLSMALLMAACTSYQRIGQFTMISTRNVDTSKEYVLIEKDVEATINNSKDDALQDCIDKAVAKIPDGEYMMNVKISMLTDGSKLKVVGDVYGVKTVKVDINTNVKADINFAVGDSVMFDRNGKITDGTIIGINSTGAIVEYENALSGKKIKKEFTYDKLTKKN